MSKLTEFPEEEKIQKKYNELRLNFEQLGKKIIEIIESELNYPKNNIEHLKTVYRIKSFDSFLNKIHRKKYYRDPFVKIKDILGVRICTFYKSDIKKVEEIIQNQFNIIEPPEDKKEKLGTSEFGYLSIHYVVELNIERKKLPECYGYADLCAEIQIRTVIEHAWAEIEHHLNYKPEKPILKNNIDLLRRLYSLSALLEVADREFDYLRKDYNVLFERSRGELDLEKIVYESFDEIIKNKSLFETTARFFLKQKQYEFLLKYSEETLKIDPQFNLALFFLGISLFNLEKENEAIDCYNKVLEIDNNFIPAWNNKGNALFRLGEYEEAIKCYDKALEIDITYKIAWNNKGNALFRLGEYEKAIKCYDKALEIDGNYKDVWYNKGVLLIKLEKYEEAIECYDTALKIDGNFKEAWNNKGVALLELGEYEKAIDCFDKALEIDSNYKEAWSNKSNTLNKLGIYEQAIECSVRALEIDNNYIRAWNNKGNALKNLKKNDEAIECYNRALEIDSYFEEPWNNKGNALVGLGKYEKAIECYDTALKIDGNLKEAWNGKGVALRELGEYEKTLECFDKALEIDSNYKEAKNNRETALIRKKNQAK